MSSATIAEYDIIFAGGGTSACVTAGRLAAADPSLKILVLEAGQHTRELPAHIQPARYFSHLSPTSTTLSFHIGQPSKSLGGRAPVVPCGHCVGGGSSVNFAMYTRAAASDYDDWENIYDNPGWGSKDLIPLLKKIETYQVKADQPTHGYQGPIKVSLGGAFTDVGKAFLEAAEKYDKGREFTEDVNALHSCNVYGRWPKYIDDATGRRSDSAHYYIYNQAHNKNLRVLDGSRVKRVIFENNRAVGVEYVSESAASLATQEVHVARASRLVVISSGAFGSPAILQRSGIGAPELLLKLDIERIVTLPGVGQNYNDHNLVFVPFLAGSEADTLDPIFRQDEADINELVAQWTSQGKGLMAHNGIDAGIKLRPNADDLQELGSEFASRWKEYFANSPDKPVIWLGQVAAYLGDHTTVPLRKYFSMAYFTEYPVSLGSLHITSGQDPHAPLHFEPGFLDEPADVVVLRWAYKRAREIARRMALYRGELQLGNPSFSEESQAACKETAGPVDISTPDIVYSPEDNEAIDEYHRKFVSTTWHSLGTCPMKPRDKGGVVDSRLNVYGVEGLKVADCSIAPANVGANTYNTALVIGEKAAIIIAEDLGIKGV